MTALTFEPVQALGRYSEATLSGYDGEKARSWRQYVFCLSDLGFREYKSHYAVPLASKP